MRCFVQKSLSAFCMRRSRAIFGTNTIDYSRSRLFLPNPLIKLIHGMNGVLTHRTNSIYSGFIRTLVRYGFWPPMEGQVVT